MNPYRTSTDRTDGLVAGWCIVIGVVGLIAGLVVEALR